jgi:hypothetical protein
MAIAARLLANGTFISSSEFDEVTQSTVSVRPGAVYAGGLDEVTGVIDASTSGTSSVSTGSVSFNGSNQRLTVPSNAGFNFGTGDFTVEAWVYLTKYWPSAYTPVFLNSYLFYIGGTGEVLIYNGTADIVSGSSGNVPLNQWVHLAWVRNSTTVKIYVNGTSVASGTSSASIASGASYNAIGFHGTTYFPGYISNLRVVKGTAVYTTNFTPSTTPLTAVTGTQLLTCQSNSSITDASTNALTITNDGTAVASSSNPFVGGSVSFNGTNQYLTWTNNMAGLQFGTGDFTLEAWVNKSANGTNGYDGLMEYGSASNAADGWYFEVSSSRGIYFVIGNTTPINYATWVNDGYWHHVAIVRSSGTVTIYKDGVALLSQSLTTSVPTSGAIGRLGESYNGTTNYYFNGNISNARVVKGTAVYTANFTPSTTPLTAIAGTSLLTAQSKTSATTDASPNTFTITNTGSVTATGISPFNTIAGTGTASTISSSAMRQVNGQMFIAGRFIEGQDSVLNPPPTYSVNYLVVGGGAAGGSCQGGGGGGAGGLLFGSTTLSKGVSYSITVGNGGSTAGTNGSPSTFSTLTAFGGGGTNQYNANPPGGFAGFPGGSGGGGSSSNVGAGGVGYGYPGIAGSTQQGYPGGASNSAVFGPAPHGNGGNAAQGGGGGAGGAGGAGATQTPASPGGPGGAGGAGITWSYTGPTIYYAGGGGGSSPSASGGGAGGSCVGGNGGSPNQSATPGRSGTGSGGGGSRMGTAFGTGGSGVVILAVPTPRYPGAYASLASTPANAPGMTVLTFTSPGSYTA